MNALFVKRTAAAGAIVLGVAVGFAAVAAAAPPGSPSPSPTSTASATATLDKAVAKDLAYMCEEERFARDVYTAIAKLYPDATAFTNIAKAEQRHMDAVGSLLERYNLDDPTDGAKAGTYSDADLTKQYAALMAKARTSLDAAYGVGVTIEKQDIADLKDLLGKNLPSDVKQVMNNLLNGSQRHLAAFTALDNGETVGGQNGSGAAKGSGSQNGSGAHGGGQRGGGQRGDGTCNQS